MFARIVRSGAREGMVMASSCRVRRRHISMVVTSGFLKIQFNFINRNNFYQFMLSSSKGPQILFAQAKTIPYGVA